MNSSVLFFVAAVVAVVSGSAVYPVHHAPVTTQYHSQDELGQYAYGYSGGPSSKHEQRTADGLTSGGYSYVDANGLVQSLAYVSDPVNGFRVSGTNLPVDSNTPHAVPVAVHHAEVPVVQRLAAAPAPYYVAAPPAPAPVATSYTSVVHHHEPAKAPAPVLAYAAPAPQVYAAPAPLTYAAPAPLAYAPPAPLAYAAPAPQVYAAPAPQVYAAPAPQVYAAPAPVAYAAAPAAVVAPVKSQFHSQDEHGQYTYGYTDGVSAKTESRYADGETKGTYSYVDDHGSVQSVHYSAGAEGFKAAGTNIPVHHV